MQFQCQAIALFAKSDLPGNACLQNDFAIAFGNALHQGLRGVVRDGVVPTQLKPVFWHESAPLAEVVRDINKYSNNVMARELYLSLGAQALGAPATYEKSERAVRQWLAMRNFPMQGLSLENGSGLSRVERISARNMGQLLLAAYESPVMPEFIASLPLVAMDGTMKRRLKATAIAGQAHIKTSFNNTIVALTDKEGNVLAWKSAGAAGFKGSRKSTPFAAQVTADLCAREGMEHGLQKVEVFLKGPGSGRETAMRSLQAAGLEIIGVRDVSPQAHNGCRARKRRRV